MFLRAWLYIRVMPVSHYGKVESVGAACKGDVVKRPQCIRWCWTVLLLSGIC